VPEKEIVARPRVNIDYAEEDKYLPWRFSIKDNPFVSPAKT
jgi:DNA-3-methyladenine glycosylase